MSYTAIQAENISKRYNLGTISSGTLFRDLNMYWAKMRGKANPYAKLGDSGEFIESEHWALRDVSFEIKQGDAVGIIGRNGAGKSTLLKILSRVTTPTTGQIKIRGRVASLLEVGTGFHPEMTGRENIFLNGAILGMTKTEISRKFDEIVDFAGIEKYIDTPVKRYSSGMYVRLAFAVAAHLEPEILIVDEVLAVGDAEFQKKCLGKMNDVSKKEGRTVLFVSHNMGAIKSLCNSGIFLKAGSLVMAGSIDKIIEKYIIGENISSEYKIDLINELVKPNYFINIFTSNTNGVKIADFKFEENVVINFQFIVNTEYNDLQIGIGLDDKYKRRVFTVLKDISFFKKNGNKYQGQIKLPNCLISPNIYSFTFALWTKGGIIFDLLENISNIKIHETGSELAAYEGNDYGTIIIQPEWN